MSVKTNHFRFVRREVKTSDWTKQGNKEVVLQQWVLDGPYADDDEGRWVDVEVKPDDNTPP